MKNVLSRLTGAKLVSIGGGVIVAVLLAGTVFTEQDQYGYSELSSSDEYTEYTIPEGDGAYTTPSPSQPSGSWDASTGTAGAGGANQMSTSAPPATSYAAPSPTSGYSSSPSTTMDTGPSSSPAPSGSGYPTDSDYSTDFSSGESDYTLEEVRHYYVSEARAAAIQPFVEIPRELRQNVAFTETRISALPVECEAMGGLYWLGDEVEEAVLGKGAAPPNAGEAYFNYKNEGLARAQNPEGSRGPNEDSYHAVEGADNAPSAEASCADPENGHAFSRYAGAEVVPGTLSVAGALSETKTRLDRFGQRIVSELLTTTVDLNVGAATIGTMVSFMRVEFPPNGEDEPVVDYRISIEGLENGGEPVQALGSEGLTIAGQDVVGADVVHDFNSQVEENSAAVEALADLGFVLVEPRTFTKVGRWGIDAPAIYAELAPQPTQGQVGDTQGVRIGTTSFQAQYSTLES